MKKIKIKDPNVRLETIAKFLNPIQADLVRNALIDHGIDCQLCGEQQGGLTGVMEISLVIRKADALKARKIIGTHFPSQVDDKSSNRRESGES